MTHWRARSRYIEDILVGRFDLKPREVDVTEWLTQGKSNWEIGRILGISESTVKGYVVKILNKLSVESRLAVFCLLNSLDSTTKCNSWITLGQRLQPLLEYRIVAL